MSSEVPLWAILKPFRPSLAARAIMAALECILRVRSPLEFLLRLRGLRLHMTKKITSPFAMGRAALEYILRVRRPLEFLLRRRGRRLDLKSKITSTFAMGRTSIPRGSCCGT